LILILNHSHSFWFYPYVDNPPLSGEGLGLFFGIKEYLDIKPEFEILPSCLPI